MSNKEEYNINLFKPKSPYAKANTTIILITILIWAIAVFGFQWLLKISEKPVPEKNYLTFTNSWTKLNAGTITNKEMRQLSNIVLSLSAKSINCRNNPVLNKFLTILIYQSLPTKLKSDFTKISNNVKTNKQANVNKITKYLGLLPTDLEAKILPYSIIPVKKSEMSQEEYNQIPLIMKKFLVHNQSALTDTKFLGFPFHYFYTAVFLLILFVALCWIYCFTIEKLNKKYGVEKEEAETEEDTP